MKTLLIHAEDATTDFLSTIYEDKEWTIIKKNIGKSKLKALIKDHDIIMMMGHGTDKETYEVKDSVTEFNQKNIYFFGEDLVFPKNAKIHQ